MSVTVSIREQALTEIEMRLSAPDDSPAQNTFRSQLDQIEQEDLPCYDVTPGDESVEDPGPYGDHTSVTRTLSIAVRVMVDAGEDGDSVLDPFYVYAIQQLAGGDATLGGIVNEVAEKAKATIFRPNGKNIIGLEMHFDLIFATKRGDPTQKG